MQSLRNIQKTERFLARQDKTRIMHISGKTCICQSEKVVVLLNEKDKETRLLTTPVRFQLNERDKETRLLTTLGKTPTE